MYELPLLSVKVHPLLEFSFRLDDFFGAGAVAPMIDVYVAWVEVEVVEKLFAELGVGVNDLVRLHNVNYIAYIFGEDIPSTQIFDYKVLRMPPNTQTD